MDIGKSYFEFCLEVKEGNGSLWIFPFLIHYIKIIFDINYIRVLVIKC